MSKGKICLKTLKKVCIDRNVASRIIPRDACMESHGKLILVRARR